MDEKSLAVAYNIKRRNRKGELTHAKDGEDSPRKARLKAELFASGGQVKEAAAEEMPLEEAADLDTMFDDEPIEEHTETPQVEESPEMKRKNRLKSLLAEI